MTPLGWAEELRPFTGAAAAGAAAPARGNRAAADRRRGRIAARRDIGTGLLPRRDSAAPRLRLLSSPPAQALRASAARLLAWLLERRRLRAHPRRGLRRASPRPGSPPSMQQRDREARRAARSSTPSGLPRRSCSSSSSSSSACSRARRSPPRGTRRPTSGSRRCSRCRSAAAAGSAGGSRSRRAGRGAGAVAGLARLGGRGLAGRRTSRWRECSRPARTACRSRSCSSGSRRSPTRSCRARAPAIAYGPVTVAFLWDLIGSLLAPRTGSLELDPVRARRARALATVPRRRRRHHARDRGDIGARCGVVLPAARPDRSVRRMSLCFRR